MLVLGVMFIVFLLLVREVHDRAGTTHGMPPLRRGRNRRGAPAMLILEDGVLVRADLVGHASAAEPHPTDVSAGVVLSMRGHRWVSILFADVISARLTPNDWVLRHGARRPIRLPLLALNAMDGPDAMNILADFDRAWNAWKRAALARKPDEAALLEVHRGESIETWFARCRALGGRAANGYRGAVIPVEILWAIIENRAASVRERIGAVVALLPAEPAEEAFALDIEPDGRLRRLQQASCGSVSPQFRAVCDAAQRKALTDEDVMRWAARELCTHAKSAYDG